MTKTEEFLALCPQPKASPVSCSGPLRATVATGVAAGRYIKGDVLTVAVWGRAKSPLVVWYFCGEEWTGTLRGNKATDRRDLRVEWVEPAQHGGCLRYRECALPGFVDSKNEEKTERNAGYLVVSHSGGGMLRQGTRKGIRRTPANRGMRAHRIVKSLDISEDVCHGLCP